MNDAGRFPALALEGVERRYGRAETTVEVLNGASLDALSGPVGRAGRAFGRGQVDAPASRGPARAAERAARSRSAASPTSTLADDARTALRRGQIGFVYQFHHLLPEFSALENLVLPQMIAGLSRAEAASRARELLGYLGLAARETPSPRRTLGRRAAARRHRPRRRQRPAGPARRRADRQPRPEDRRSRVRHADDAGQGDRPRRPDRHPQHGPRRPHGPPGDDPRRAGDGDGVGKDLASSPTTSAVSTDTYPAGEGLYRRRGHVG